MLCLFWSNTLLRVCSYGINYSRENEKQWKKTSAPRAYPVHSLKDTQCSAPLLLLLVLQGQYWDALQVVYQEKKHLNLCYLWIIVPTYIQDQQDTVFGCNDKPLLSVGKTSRKASPSPDFSLPFETSVTNLLVYRSKTSWVCFSTRSAALQVTDTLERPLFFPHLSGQREDCQASV